MAQETRIQNLLSELNSALGIVTPYKLAAVAPGAIQRLKKNAHYMPKGMFDRLTSNIAKDGNLSSMPFCWFDGDRYICLSGNHRVMAAIEANVSLILILYTDAAMTRSEQVARQLSHNSIFGKDDTQLLRELWEEILDLEFKEYSGLDETELETMAASAEGSLGVGNLAFEEIRLLFLPDEADRLETVIKQLAKHRRFAGRLEDFDQFFDTLLTFKEASGIVNSATAFVAIIEILEAWLAKPPSDSS